MNKRFSAYWDLPNNEKKVLRDRSIDKLKKGISFEDLSHEEKDACREWLKIDDARRQRVTLKKIPI